MMAALSTPTPLLPQRQSDAFFAGYRGYEHGLKFRDNPYPRRTPEHAQWVRGWKHGKSIYEDGWG